MRDFQGRCSKNTVSNSSKAMREMRDTVPGPLGSAVRGPARRIQPERVCHGAVGCIPAAHSEAREASIRLLPEEQSNRVKVTVASWRSARRVSGRVPSASLAVAALALLFLRTDALTNPMDKAILLQLYNTTHGDGWREGYRWTRGVHKDLDPCDDTEFFKGVSCSGLYGDADRRATKILLSSMGLNGTLPTDIGNLTMLEELLLTVNNISGILPPSLCRMKHLHTLDLTFNSVSGTIPECIGEMTRLYKLDLRTNMLEGTIPKQFGVLQEVLL